MHQGVFTVLGKLGENFSVVKTFSIKHLDDPRIYISTETDIRFVIQAAAQYVKNDQRPPFFEAHFFHRHVRGLLYDLQVRHLEPVQEKILAFALFSRHQDSVKQVNLPLRYFLTPKRQAGYRLQRKGQIKKGRWKGSDAEDTSIALR